ncbi:MAG: hypothetical protein ACW99L_07395, partial [Promethearchaeota archaeon]
LAGYHISDIDVVAVIDISENKVGRSVSEAIRENDLDVVNEFHQEIKIPVEMGKPLDGVIDETKGNIKPAKIPSIDVAEYFKSTGTEIVLCLLPSGADNAVKFYAEETLKANCAFINTTPTIIATDNNYNRKFKEAGLALIGDDLQDQFGATFLHKMILQQMIDRGIEIKESYALDVGGGAESLNTIYRAREIKREIKSKSVAGALRTDAPIVAGTSDWVEFLKNKRNSMLWIIGKGFLGSEIVMDIKIQTEDGPNGGSILADVIRATKVAINQGAAGSIDEISAYGFKNPPDSTRNPSEASQNLANFILGINRRK